MPLVSYISLPVVSTQGVVSNQRIEVNDIPEHIFKDIAQMDSNKVKETITTQKVQDKMSTLQM